MNQNRKRKNSPAFTKSLMAKFHRSETPVNYIFPVDSLKGLIFKDSVQLLEIAIVKSRTDVSIFTGSITPFQDPELG